MTQIKKLFKHSSHYFIGSFIVIMGSLISFPIFTRIFSVSDYGILSLVNSTLVFSVAISKLGLQQSAVRFYGEFKTNKRQESLSVFYSTLFLSPIVIGTIMGLLLLIFPIIFPSRISSNLASLFFLVAVLIPVRCGHNTFTEFLMAEQRTKFYNILSIIMRYGSLSFIIIFVFYLVEGIHGFFWGSIVIESIIFIWIVSYLLKSQGISFFNISKEFLYESLKYSLPLLGSELATNILLYGDRFLILYFLEAYQLGIYSAGYNFSMYLTALLIGPLRLAITPIYMDIWTNEGEEKTKEFLSNAFKYFFLIALPFVFGVCVIKKDIIVLLASGKYVQSHEIIPYIITGILTGGAYIIGAAGIHIYKKTYFITISVFASGLLNLVLNIFLIPVLGIKGAAISTLISYLIYFLLVFMYSRKLLKFSINIKAILLYLLFSIVMFLTVAHVNIESNLLVNLFVKILTGIMIYCTFILLYDSKIRSMVAKYIFD